MQADVKVCDITGNSKRFRFGDIAIDDQGLVYGSSSVGKKFEFFTVKLTASGCGNYRKIGTGKGLQIAFGDDGRLYGHDVGNGALSTINTSNGVASPTGCVTKKFSDLASGPATVPCPCDFSLAGLAEVLVDGSGVEQCYVRKLGVTLKHVEKYPRRNRAVLTYPYRPGIKVGICFRERERKRIEFSRIYGAEVAGVCIADLRKAAANLGIDCQP